MNFDNSSSDSKRNSEIPARIINRKWAIITTVSSIAILIFIYIYAQKPNSLCRETGNGVNIPRWQITGTNHNGNASILWQKSGITGLRTGGIPNSKIAVSSTHVLVARDTLISLCDSGEDITAYKLDTGEKDWSFPAKLIHWINTVDNGYLLLYGDTNITKINDNGQQLWFPPALPPRSARILFISRNDIYLPVGDNTYRLAENNKDLSVLQNASIVGAFDDFLVFQNGQISLRILDTDNQQEIMSIHLTESIDQYSVSPKLYLNYYNDILLLFYGSERTHRIEAYRVSTGQQLWNMDREFNSVPIILEGKIISYKHDGNIEIYNLDSGEMSGKITLSRNNNDPNPDSKQTVWLAGFDETLSILHQDTGELITLYLEI